MSFANPLMLIGLAAVAIPVLIHLFHRRKARDVEWGAMQFLLGSVVSRHRRMLLEEMLLLVLRCLLIAFLVLAMALPFVPPGSRVPWQVLLPAMLVGAAAIGAATTLWRYPRWHRGLFAVGALLILMAGGAAIAERFLQVGVWSPELGEQDVVVIVDGSASMTVAVDGRSNFDRAVDEARAVLMALGPQDAAALLVAGPGPEIRTPSPVLRPDRLEKTLDELRPTGGRMDVRRALGAAAEIFGRGHSLTRRIVFITDGQDTGWKDEGLADWAMLAEPFAAMPPATRPRLVLRLLRGPEEFRNVQVKGISLSRRVVGSDRPVKIRVEIENTGDVAITTPVEVTLRIDGEKRVLRSSVGDLTTGAVESVTFRNRFERAGTHSIEARAEIADDLPSDNVAARVIRTFEQVSTLLVDGNPSTRPFDRASAFLLAALTPEPEEIDREDLPPGSDEVASERLASGDLFDVTVIDAPDVDSVTSLDPYDVVVLADVPRLSAEAAARLAAFVNDGGGLLVAPGEHATPRFYEGWRTRDGYPVAPARLQGRETTTELGEVVRPAGDTLEHPAFRVILDTPRSDIVSTSVVSYWRLAIDAADISVRIGARLDTDAPLLVGRQVGDGRVLMTAFSLDSKDSTIATRKCFVPLVHELIMSLVELRDPGLELDPANRVVVPLAAAPGAGDRLAPGGGGLRGTYYGSPALRHARFVRRDEQPVLRWSGSPAPGVPADGFSVRWTGTLSPPRPGSYTFHLVGDDEARLWIDGRLVVESVAAAAQTGVVDLAAAPTGGPSRHGIRLELVDRAGEGSCQLSWQGPGISLQPIPSTVLDADEPWRRYLESGLDATLKTPSGATRSLPVDSVDGSLSVLVERATRSGLYSLELPPSMRDDFRELTIAGAVPFAVRGYPEESHLSMLTDADLDGASEHLDLFAIRSTADLMRALTGRVPGARLWRHMAIAALLAAVLEIALAGWIARQRRTGATTEVDFTSASDASAYRAAALEAFGLGEGARKSD